MLLFQLLFKLCGLYAEGSVRRLAMIDELRGLEVDHLAEVGSVG